MEEPKNPDTCNVFALYKLLAPEAEVIQMRKNYEAGNYGYGHAKQALYETLLSKFETPRERYHYYMEHLDEIDKALQVGAKKATLVANEVLKRVRATAGY